MDIKSILMGKCRGTLSDLPSYLMGNGSGTGYTRTDLERKFTRSVSAGSASIKPHGRAVIKTIRGNTVVWNQIAHNYKNWSANGTKRMVDDVVEWTPTWEFANLWDASATKIVAGHKYYSSIEVYQTVKKCRIGLYNIGVSPEFVSIEETNEWVRKDRIATPTISRDATTLCFLLQCITSDTSVVFMRNAMLIDLTEMFGAGNEPSTVEEFRAMFPNEYYAYSEPTLLSFNGNGIKSYDSSKNVVGSCTIPTSTYFADGMKSAGTVYDELLPNKAIKRIEKADLGSIGWTKSQSYADVFVSSWTVSKVKEPTSVAEKANIASVDYSSVTYNQLTVGGVDNSMTIIWDTSSLHGQLWIRDNSKSDMTALQFKAAMSGVILYYELAELVETEINPPLNLSYIVDNGGEEEMTVKTGVTETAPFSGVVEYSVSKAADVCDPAASEGGEK